jgi:hypothetical protein
LLIDDLASNDSVLFAGISLEMSTPGSFHTLLDQIGKNVKRAVTRPICLAKKNTTLRKLNSEKNMASLFYFQRHICFWNSL